MAAASHGHWIINCDYTRQVSGKVFHMINTKQASTNYLSDSSLKIWPKTHCQNSKRAMKNAGAVELEALNTVIFNSQKKEAKWNRNIVLENPSTFMKSHKFDKNITFLCTEYMQCKKVKPKYLCL